jgi:hypothetical protein
LPLATLYRAMTTDPDGQPRVSPSARAIGVRQEDVLVDEEDMVDPEAGGMSVCPNNPFNLEEHRRPAEFGGHGRDPVWMIEEDVLIEGLLYRPDPDDPAKHGFIEPAWRMSVEDYEELLALTRDDWRLV